MVDELFDVLGIQFRRIIDETSDDISDVGNIEHRIGNTHDIALPGHDLLQLGQLFTRQDALLRQRLEVGHMRVAGKFHPVVHRQQVVAHIQQRPPERPRREAVHLGALELAAAIS